MNDGISGAAVAAGIKLYGFKAFFGMIGTSLLYLALPPENIDGTLNKKEFVFRLACAGIASALFGDGVFDYLVLHFPTIHFESLKAAVYLLVGAPAWLVTRAVALWANRAKDKDAGQIIKDIKDDLS